jgi:4-azaleucine resistance transporter AzlC
VTSAPEDIPSPGAEFRAGVRNLAPILLGVAPFGLVFGVLALANGLTPAQAFATSSVIFAGSSQFVLAQLAGLGAPAVVMVSSVGLVNLRHALYSASLAPHVAHLPLRWKLGLAYLLTDEAFAAVVGRYARDRGPNRHWYFLGAGLALWTGWQLSTAVGIAAGAELPRTIPLEFALPLTFIAIAVPLVRTRPALLAALVASGVALATAGWPYKLGLMLSAVAGILAGWLASGRGRRLA